MFDNLLYIPLITGPIFMIAGFIMLKYPPKKINYLYGYRTRSSMKSQERWDFAQNYSSKELINLGFFLTLMSFIGKFIEADENTQITAGLILTVLTCIVLFVRVENAIKDKFGKN
ncbi:MAG: SdpI family protein [Weeksellaceae bacterium]|jgi:uncharacterized membrane protein|nr:SdpI family protein [Weeksellaceae bacterium]MDX9705570.1 SdpI family protein [Weeksellaceae bacterium]